MDFMAKRVLLDLKSQQEERIEAKRAKLAALEERKAKLQKKIESHWTSIGKHEYIIELLDQFLSVDEGPTEPTVTDLEAPHIEHEDPEQKLDNIRALLKKLKAIAAYRSNE